MTSDSAGGDIMGASNLDPRPRKRRADDEEPLGMRDLSVENTQDIQEQQAIEAKPAVGGTEPAIDQLDSTSVQAGRPAALATALPATPPLRRAIVTLVACVAFGAMLVLSMTLDSAGGAAPAPCSEGASIAQAAVAADSAGAIHLFAIVRPPAYPNTALGDEPGCQALYRSDDSGVTWTVSFSATAEAPLALAQAGGTRLYLLTTRLQFPLSLAGSVYRSDSLGAPWTWTRVSPQQRSDVPVVALSDLALEGEGAILVRAANGDGAALLRSTDGGKTWQPVIVPGLLSTASMGVLDRLIAVAPAHYTPGESPGLASGDGGNTWTLLGPLPAPPQRSDLNVVLHGNAIVNALTLDLVPAGAVLPDHPVARYTSLDHGHSWSRLQCGALPQAGCAPATRWAQAGTARYVLYRRRIFRSQDQGTWQPLTVSLPVPSDTVLSLLAAPSPNGDQVYLVTPTGIFRLEQDRWRNAAPGLALGGPTPVDG